MAKLNMAKDKQRSTKHYRKLKIERLNNGGTFGCYGSASSSCSTSGQLILILVCVFVCFMVFNATFKNISGISWRSVLLVAETGVHGENHRPVASH